MEGKHYRAARSKKEEKKRRVEIWNRHKKLLATIGGKGEGLFDRVIIYEEREGLEWPKGHKKILGSPLPLPSSRHWRLALSEEKEDREAFAQSLSNTIEKTLRGDPGNIDQKSLLEFQASLFKFSIEIALDLWLVDERFREWLSREVLSSHISYKKIRRYWQAIGVPFAELETLDIIPGRKGKRYPEHPHQAWISLVDKIRAGLKANVPSIPQYLREVTRNALIDLGRELGSEKRGGVGILGLRKQKEKPRHIDIFKSLDLEEELDDSREEFLEDEKALEEFHEISIIHDLNNIATTERQRKAAYYLGKGYSLEEISQRLGVSRRTIINDLKKLKIR